MQKAKKKFGQNFLTDKNLLIKIVDEAKLDSKMVVEIGPGQGALTQFIVQKASKLTAYEVDLDLKPVLDKLESKHSNLKVIYKDFLKEDLSSYKNASLIGNIPYYITGPILFKFLEEEGFNEATFMMQKEVGERIIADSDNKKYNALSVLFQWLTSVNKVLNVNRKMFRPIPKVDSVVLRFVKNELPNDESDNKNDIINFIKNIFQQKRKTMINNLHASYNIDKEKLSKWLISENYRENIRAEQIHFKNIVKLALSFIISFEIKS